MIKSRPRSSWFTKVSITLTVYNNATVCVPVFNRPQCRSMLKSSHMNQVIQKCHFLRLFSTVFFFTTLSKHMKTFPAVETSSVSSTTTPIYRLLMIAGSRQCLIVDADDHRICTCNQTILYIRWQQILKSRSSVPWGLILPNIVS